MHMLILACLAVLPAAPAAAQPEVGACDTLQRSVRTLGTKADPDPNRTVGALHGCGVSAARLLIEELRVIDPEVVDDRWWHMVWCERALRSITGKRFQFRSTEELGRLAEFQDERAELSYAMEWMSHGTVYVAPRDVQAKVIGAWRNWIAVNRGHFDVAPFTSYGEWHW